MARYLKKIIPVLILVILTAGGFEIFYRSDFTRPIAKSPEPKSEDTAKNIAAPISDVERKLPDSQAILTRNLFGPSAEEITSSMMDKEQIAPVTLEATSLELSLLGTITGSPKNRRAIILDKKKKVQDIYSQGDVIQDALIKEIQREKLILTRNGSDELLVREISKTTPASPTQPALLPQEPPETAPDTPPEIPSEERIEPQPVESVESVESVENSTQ